jgi:2-hydroxychromene-2-carboxylate isomerase
MSIAARIRGRAIAAYLGPTFAGARDLARSLSRAPVKLELFHDAADPWSHLAAQVADRLVAAYGVELAVHVVSPPASDVDPAPTLRTRHAVRDAHELAGYWDLEFPGKREADPTLLRKVTSSLIRPRPPAEQLRAILELGAAMWAADGKAVDRLLGALGTESSTMIQPALAEAYAGLRERGHYQGGMLAYRGEWYGGVDRLRYLEERLAADAGTAPVGVVGPRPEAERGPTRLATGDGPPVLDLWFSFNSPYSYLALERIADVLAPYPAVELRLRPVAPMIDRGMPLPRPKRIYIARDAKREADRLGIAFGNLCEATGAAAANALAIEKWALTRGKGLDFARSALRGSWAEAQDLASYVDLRRVVERAGLPWEGARAALADPDAPGWASANAADLAVAGMWGVPSFRIGDLALWGQDRLDILADRLRRHFA